MVPRLLFHLSVDHDDHLNFIMYCCRRSPAELERVYEFLNRVPIYVHEKGALMLGGRGAAWVDFSRCLPTSLPRLASSTPHRA